MAGFGPTSSLPTSAVEPGGLVPGGGGGGGGGSSGLFASIVFFSPVIKGAGDTMSDREPLDTVIRFDAVTHNPGTGAIADADSTPTFEVFEDATDTDIGVGGNLTKRTSKTGNYRGSF